GNLPSPAADAPITGLWSADGQLIALGNKGVWRFDEKQNAWTRAGNPPDSRVVSVTSDGRLAFWLETSGDTDAITRIQRVSWASDSLTTSSLPALPAPLNSAQAALAQG